MSEPSEDRIRDAVTLAKNMWNNGASRATIEGRMARRGLDQMEIETVLGKLPAAEPRNLVLHSDPTVGNRKVLVFVGLTISGIGLLLAIGNRSGLAPSFPFFGLAVIILGGAIANAGRS